VVQFNMAVAPVVVQSSLCFLVKKFGKIGVRQLKSMVIDFYDVEELNAAKQQLLIDAGNMNLDISLPHIPGRRFESRAHIINLPRREFEVEFTTLLCY